MESCVAKSSERISFATICGTCSESAHLFSAVDIALEVSVGPLHKSIAVAPQQDSRTISTEWCSPLFKKEEHESPSTSREQPSVERGFATPGN